jgi:hypothetical protein
MLDNTVQPTNQYIIIQPNFRGESEAKLAGKIKMKDFIGLVCLEAVLRSKWQSLRQLWGTGGDGIEQFRLVVSQRRFKVHIRRILE